MITLLLQLLTTPALIHQGEEKEKARKAIRATCARIQDLLQE